VVKCLYCQRCKVYSKLTDKTSLHFSDAAKPEELSKDVKIGLSIKKISSSKTLKNFPNLLFSRNYASHEKCAFFTSICFGYKQTYFLLALLHQSFLVYLSEAWLSERLRRWSNKPDVIGSIPVTTEFFLICDSNQVPKWFGTHLNL